jgi:DNA-binding NarL/FixJ family response regulator
VIADDHAVVREGLRLLLEAEDDIVDHDHDDRDGDRGQDRVEDGQARANAPAFRLPVL